MGLLYYWRGDNYRRDLDDGVAYHLNQRAPALHGIPIGASLWAFTRREDGAYVLAAELVISAHTMNPAGYRYGPYRVWGDLRRSRYFAVQGAPSVEPIIRRTSLQPKPAPLGQSFQGRAAVRAITLADEHLLRAFAASLPLEPRATLIDEDTLEQAWQAANDELVSALLGQRPGPGAQRGSYLRQRTRRSRPLVHRLRALYGGRCQVCAWRSDGEIEVCEAHHVRWLSRGGEDDLHNLALLCPNHHRIIHALDAPFDFLQHAFITAAGPITLQLQHHQLS